MRLSEVVFHLQEMAAASRLHIDTVPAEEGTKAIMLAQAIALEEAAKKLNSMLPRSEQDAVAARRKAN